MCDGGKKSWGSGTPKPAGQCMPMSTTDGMFNHVDTDKSGKVSFVELWNTLKQFAASKKYTITPADEQWVKNWSAKTAGSDS